MIYPVLSIRNFGKIEKADIELSPLTLFVGDNNSGKSYLLSLIWGILNINNNINYVFKLNDNINDSDVYKNCLNIIKNVNGEYNLTNEDLKQFIELYNLFLYENKKELIRYIFSNNYSKINIEEIRIQFPNKENLNVLIKINELNSSITTNNFKFELNNNAKNESYIIIFLFMIYKSIFSEFNLFCIKNTFLPTSRTGFILSYKQLAANSIENNDNNLMCRPIVRFIQNLILLNEENKESKNSLLNFIENNMIYGNIDIDETDNLYYKPIGTDINFSLNISSAVVTEISPLYLFLKYGVIDTNIFIEEPEISLHPELQQKMSQLLIQMVNDKKNIFITTHSDTIVQHINNMISLYHNSESNKKEFFEKYNYSDKDIINEDNIRMYQFDVNKQTLKTEIKELKSSKYGFELPTFNEILKNIHNEIIDFHSDI